MEGYGMFLFTKFGDPVPWSKEEVQVYTAKLRNELKNPRFHIYHEAYVVQLYFLARIHLLTVAQ